MHREKKLKNHYGKIFAKNRPKSYLARGFTIFELLIVMSIAAVVTVITFSSFPKMNSTLSLDLLTQDIALTIRQAQVYGTTVFGSGMYDDQFNSYGIDLPDPNHPDVTSGQEPYTITLFADIGVETIDINGNISLEQNYKFDGKVSSSNPCGNPQKTIDTTYETSNECVEQFRITGKNFIKAICPKYSDGDLTKDGRIKRCLTGSDDNYKVATFSRSDYIKNTQDRHVTIVYNRPNLNPELTIWKKDDNYVCQDCNNIGIVIESEAGLRRVVVVWSNGQIAVDR